MRTEIKILSNAEALARRGAEEFTVLANAAVQGKGAFAVALSGGTTPKALFALLAADPAFREKVPWAQSHFFWVDERHVPPDDPASNYRLAWTEMLAKVPVPTENVHRIPSELPDAREAAVAYEVILRNGFHLAQGELPRFDLILLGMGKDGHTASLFPGTEALGEQQRLVVANWVEALKSWRITLTLPVLNHAVNVMFLVSGAEKAAVVQAVLETQAESYPARLIRPGDGRLLWLLDEAAASRLRRAELGPF